MIYLDNHATTPCDPRVVEAMLPYFSERYANPASEIHRMGREARIAVEKARKQVAELVGAESEEIIFTGSATESNNLAILGLALSPETQYRNHIFASSIEHKSVISPCRVLEQRGFDFKILAVDKSGHVIKERADEVLDDHSLLVSIQAANNEIGTIQNIKTLSGIVHECGGLFHCDAAQAVGKIPIDVQVLNIDLMSISAHKMYGPKGIGALYIRGGGGNSKLKPILYGGDQEFGLRAGTLNVPLIVGFGEACRIADSEMKEEAKRLSLIRDELEAKLIYNVPGIKINGDLKNRLPNNSSITLLGIDAESLIMSLPDIALSSGSACNSGAQEPSYVLKAIGLSYDEAKSTFRIGLGRFNTSTEIESAAAAIFAGIDALLKK